MAAVAAAECDTSRQQAAQAATTATTRRRAAPATADTTRRRRRVAIKSRKIIRSIAAMREPTLPQPDSATAMTTII